MIQDSGARTLSKASREYVLAFADDEHLVGARHTSWIGLGPFLEEDLAFCSIAQDELGHAIALYDLIIDDDPHLNHSDLDEFAILRDPPDYRSCRLAELRCDNWIDSLVRHWLYDRAESIRWEALLRSSNDQLAAIAERALLEEAFHIAHSTQLMSLIASRQPAPIVESIQDLLPLALELWDPVEAESAVISERVASAPMSELAVRWEQTVRADLAHWKLDIQWPSFVGEERPFDHVSGRYRRSDDFAEFHADLRKVLDIDRAATW